MRRRAPHFLYLAILSLPLLAWSHPASSQQLAIGGSSSNYGTINLAPGFAPDPHRVSVISGGSIDVRDLGLGSGCVGYATSQPDYIVQLTGTSDRLRFFNESDGDTGLVINDPSGNWHCNDDSYGSTNPTVTLQGAGAGQYDIWITSYTSGDNINGMLSVTELDYSPGSGGSATYSLHIGGSESNYGRVSLAPGFTPDPHTVSIISGGSLDVGDLGLGSACVGYATEQPDFIVEFSGKSSMLRFYVDADGDTALVINGPDGAWHCNDDSYSGLNPSVDFDSAQGGQYDVWVTSYATGENIEGTLHVTELESNHPEE